MGAPEGQTIRFAGDAGFYTDDIVVYFSKYCILQFSYIFGMHAWLLFWNISIYLFIYLFNSPCTYYSTGRESATAFANYCGPE
jgi:hypothetical protein